MLEMSRPIPPRPVTRLLDPTPDKMWQCMRMLDKIILIFTNININIKNGRFSRSVRALLTIFVSEIKHVVYVTLYCLNNKSFFKKCHQLNHIHTRASYMIIVYAVTTHRCHILYYFNQKQHISARFARFSLISHNINQFKLQNHIDLSTISAQKAQS